MTINEKCYKQFANGVVYLLETSDGFPIETTDTFLPYYTKDAIGNQQNALVDANLGSRGERWMIGISTMSGCPVRCKFCATGKLKKWRKLTAAEMVEQVEFIVNRNEQNPLKSKEFKINWTRMGEPFLNIENVKEAVSIIREKWPNVHNYISTVGIAGSDFSWIDKQVTLQFSIHSFDEHYRDWLIPISKKMSLEDMGQVVTGSDLKTTLNLTLVREEDFNIKELTRLFDPTKFFIKLSPINPNDISDINGIKDGVIHQTNVV